ncbi:MAG: dihydrofolate reductase [Pseudomonadota bacterium]
MATDIRNCIIVAKARNGVIGNEGQLPWRLAADLAFFKNVTSGKPIIMGRKTWESLPVRPLPNRANIVISRNWNYAAKGARVYSSLGVAVNAARSIARRDGVDEIFIIGGASIYARALPISDRLYVTDVEAEPDGDVVFPTMNADRWQEVWERPHKADDKNDYAFTIRRYDCRIHKPPASD